MVQKKGFTDEHRMYTLEGASHCLCGMSTMGAKGQFRLHSSDRWGHRNFRSCSLDGNRSHSAVLAWHENAGPRPAPSPECFLEGGLFWMAEGLRKGSQSR